MSHQHLRKTQIALSYIYWLQNICPEVSVFWVHASSAERFLDSYAFIAQKCKIPGHNDPEADTLSLVRTWLERTYRDRWLMVIDNADDTELFFQPRQQDNTHPSAPTIRAGQLGSFVPTCPHGSVLITSRNKQTASRLAPGKPPIGVGSMTDMEALQLVRVAMGDDEIPAEITTPLAARLEHLPLALAQASAFIRENSITIDDYMQLLDESDGGFTDRLSEPFEAFGRESDTPHAVTATWIVSFKQIEKQHNFASSVLSMVSLLDRQSIPESFIKDYYVLAPPTQPTEESDLAAVTKAIGILQAFSFISKGTDKTVGMHGLVQLVTRKWLVMTGKMGYFAQAALKLVSNAFPYGELENRNLCLQYLPHAIAILATKNKKDGDAELELASLLHEMSGMLLFQGRCDDAEKYLVEAVDARQRVLGEEHPHTLRSKSNLAATYRDQGRLTEAESLELQVMETRQRVLGEEHPDTLSSKARLAATYRKQGRWTEAESLQVQVMETRQRVLGEEHPHTLDSKNSLALTYRKQGRWTEAESLYLQLMETKQRVLGEVHPHTVASKNNLALTCRKQGRWTEAESLELQLMGTTQRMLGEEHPHTLVSKHNLAAIYWGQGRWTEAEPLELQVMETRQRVLGEEHPHTLSSKNNLAAIYSKQGRWTEAESLELQVMETRQRVLGEEHPDTLSSKARLAATYRKQGRWTEAESLQVQVMETRQRVPGEEHPDVLTSMNSLTLT